MSEIPETILDVEESLPDRYHERFQGTLAGTMQQAHNRLLELFFAFCNVWAFPLWRLVLRVFLRVTDAEK